MSASTQAERATTLSNNIVVVRKGNVPVRVELPDGVVVDLPEDFAETIFTAQAAGFTPHRRFPTFKSGLSGGVSTPYTTFAEDFTFVGGIYPPPGKELPPEDYAELITHPFCGRADGFQVLEKVSLSRSSEPVDVSALDDDDLLAELERRGVIPSFTPIEGPPEPSSDDDPEGVPVDGLTQTFEDRPEVGKGDVTAAVQYLVELDPDLDVEALKTTKGTLSAPKIRTAAEALGVTFSSL